MAIAMGVGKITVALVVSLCSKSTCPSSVECKPTLSPSCKSGTGCNLKRRYCHGSEGCGRGGTLFASIQFLVSTRH